jgi:hypothetical protein
MPTTVINEFTLEPKAGPPPAALAAGGAAAGSAAAGAGGASGAPKGSPDTAREIERVLRHDRHRAMRLWAY